MNICTHMHVSNLKCMPNNIYLTKYRHFLSLENEHQCNHKCVVTITTTYMYTEDHFHCNMSIVQ